MVMCVGGNVVAAIFRVARTRLYGVVGQADVVEGILIGFDAGAIDFYLNDVGVDALDRGA
jgi:hypothetical protein